MNRRSVLLGLAACLSSGWRAARGDLPADRPIVGYLSTHTTWAPRYREALAEVGYVDGKNVTFLWVGGDDSVGELPKLANQMANSRVRLILVDSTVAALAAKNATKTIPIVLSHVTDPVGFGLVDSLARPTGNITGITSMTVDATAKRLELLKEVVPKRSRVAVVLRPANPLAKKQAEDAATAAKQLDLRIQRVAVKDEADLETAFASIREPHQTSVLITDDTLFWNRLSHIASLSIKHSLAAIGGTRLFPEGGGLLSYGASPREQYQRAAFYVDRILRGATPSDLPIERATKFELVVNLKTARSLGITIPQSTLLRADEVIR